MLNCENLYVKEHRCLWTFTNNIKPFIQRVVECPGQPLLKLGESHWTGCKWEPNEEKMKKVKASLVEESYIV